MVDADLKRCRFSLKRSRFRKGTRQAAGPIKLQIGPDVGSIDKHRHGKTCFNFKAIDEGSLTQLGDLTRQMHAIVAAAK